MNKRPCHLQTRDLAWVMLFVLFAAVILFSVRSTPLIFDSARHALIARNLIEGHGLVVSYPDYTPITITSSGPTLIFPGALLMAITGNTLWSPALAAAILHVSLLGIFLVYIRRIMPSAMHMAASTALLLFFFLWYDPVWWTYFIGEISSLLLLFIACTMTATAANPNSSKHYYLIGLIAALSLLARPMTLPGFAGLGTYLLVVYFKEQRNIATLFKRVCAGLAGLLTIEIPFRVYETCVAQQYGFTASSYWAAILEIYSNNSALGLTALAAGDNILKAILDNTQQNIDLFKSTSGRYGIHPFIAGSLWGLAILAGLIQGCRLRTPASRFILVLTLGLAYYSVWFFFLCQSTGFDRYLLHPVLVLLTLLAVLLIQARPLLSCISCIGLLLLCMPAKQASTFREMLMLDDIGWMDGKARLYNSQIIDATGFLSRRSFDYPLVNCGWIGSTPEIELLLPDTGNFRDCFPLIENALEPRATPTDEQYYQWKHPVSFTLVINKLQWRFAKAFVPNRKRHWALMQACSSQTVYQSLLYQVMECPFEALKKTIPLDRNSPFVGTPEEWHKEP